MKEQDLTPGQMLCAAYIAASRCISFAEAVEQLPGNHSYDAWNYLYFQLNNEAAKILERQGRA